MNTVETIIDPTGHFAEKGATSQRSLNEAAGILPYFFIEAVLKGNDTPKSILAEMVSIYGFGDYADAFKGGEVDAKGVYQSQYEEDAPMYPLLSITSTDATLYVYQYAMLAVTNGDETFITRMD